MVSFPATTSRTKNEASSAGVSCSPSMLAVASAVVRSSAGRLLPLGRQPGDQVGQVLARGQDLPDGLVHVLG